MRILIIKPSSLGDIFHVFPALCVLKERYPDAIFDFLINPAFADVLDYSPVKISRKLFFERKKLGRVRSFFSEFFKLFREIRRERYDLVVDFQGLFRSAICVGMAKAADKIGFANPREKISEVFYRHSFFADPAMHAIRRNLALAAKIAGCEGDLDAAKYMSGCPEETETRFQERVSKIFSERNVSGNAALIGVIPGARWASKAFAPELFAGVINQVGSEVAEPKPCWLIIGGKADRKIGKKIRELAANGNVIDLTGETTVGEMLEIIRRCDMIVSNDSGPVHAAAAFGKELFAFFGPTSPEKTGPLGEKIHVFQRNDLHCIKCLKRNCGGKMACHELDAGEVSRSIVKSLTKI